MDITNIFPTYLSRKIEQYYRNFIIFYRFKSIMSETHDLVFDLSFNLTKRFTFFPWLQLSLTCTRYSSSSFRSRIYKLFRKYVLDKMIANFGQEFTDILFSNNFGIMGGFVLDCIYDTNYCSDLDIIKSEKEVSKHAENQKFHKNFDYQYCLQLNISNHVPRCYYYNNYPRKSIADREDTNFSNMNKINCPCGGRSHWCEHETCNPDIFDSLSVFRHMLNGNILQYPPGYQTDSDIWQVESHYVTCKKSIDSKSITENTNSDKEWEEYKDEEDNNHEEEYKWGEFFRQGQTIHNSDDPNAIMMDFITILDNRSTRQFVNDNDFAFCRVLFDNNGLFIGNAYSMITKTCTFTKEDTLRNYNRTVTKSQKIYEPDWNKLLKEYRWYDIERVEKYETRGFIINVDEDLKNAKPKRGFDCTI